MVITEQCIGSLSPLSFAFMNVDKNKKFIALNIGIWKGVDKLKSQTPEIKIKMQKCHANIISNQ